ncbi:hypothetical protein GCM10020331_035980 [Ectobacillus funiculus]
MERIYLDHAATSPTHPKVVESMLPYMTEIFGNPSSIHYYGRQSRHAVDEARRACAKKASVLSQMRLFFYIGRNGGR